MHFDSIVSNFSGRFKIGFRRHLDGVAYDSVQIEYVVCLLNFGTIEADV